MVFSSLDFAIFFPIFYAVYLLAGRNLLAQNAWLLCGSYFFYAWWDWRFLSLLIGLTLLNYYSAFFLTRFHSDQARRRIMVIAVAGNLSILGFFKYFNFFQENLIQLGRVFGLQLDPWTLSIALPVGISFFVFQGLGYVIDVLRARPDRIVSLFDFATFKAFFPQLVAGPIERSKSLLPQIQRPRSINPGMVTAGLGLIVWGLYKKVVIADNLAPIATAVFGDPASQSGGELLLGAVAFSFQIYCDFSAYSDIARGISFLLGIDLMVNFRTPYFSTSPSEFWRRWHISLSSWLRDYLYISMGGNRGGKLKTARNLMATMLLGGLWHGAAWTFVAWGAYHGLLLVLQRVVSSLPGVARLGAVPSLVPVRMLMMFSLATIGWVFFRAGSMGDALHILGNANFKMSPAAMDTASRMTLLIGPLLLWDLLQFKRPKESDIPRWPAPVLGAFLGSLVCVLMLYAARQSSEFIYFAF